MSIQDVNEPYGLTELTASISFKFEDAVTAFRTTQAGKSEDGKGVIKAIISGPGVADEDN